MRDANYLKFLREEGKCCACVAHLRQLGWGEKPSYPSGCCDPAHGPVNGRGSKGPDDGAIPLCRKHHEEQHSLTWPAFESKYGFSRETEAKVWWTAYLIYKEHAEC